MKAIYSLVPLLALLVGCDPPDRIFSIQLSNPSALCAPTVNVSIDSSGALRWEATRLLTIPQQKVYVMWLAASDFSAGSWVNLGEMPVAADGSGYGVITPAKAGVMSFATETRSILVTAESDLRATTPTGFLDLWTSRFPRYGDLVATPMAYGDARANLRLQDYISKGGDLGSPTRGFGRFEIRYLENMVKFRMWNFSRAPAGHAFVLWVSNHVVSIPMTAITDFEDLKPTRPTQVNGFDGTATEFQKLVPYDPEKLPYGEVLEVSMSYELVTPKPFSEYGIPLGVRVLHGEPLTHEGLTDYPQHGGGGSGDACAASGGGHGGH